MIPPLIRGPLLDYIQIKCFDEIKSFLHNCLQVQFKFTDVFSSVWHVFNKNFYPPHMLLDVTASTEAIPDIVAPVTRREGEPDLVVFVVSPV